jgi:hypothetical protein
MRRTIIAALGAACAVALAAPAHADNGDVGFISYLEQHNLGCGEGALKCNSDADLIGVGHSVCYDIDHNGQSAYEAADKLVSVGEGWLNKLQANEIVAAAVVAYCPWDKV